MASSFASRFSLLSVRGAPEGEDGEEEEEASLIYIFNKLLGIAIYLTVESPIISSPIIAL